MAVDPLFGPTIQLLGKTLDLRARRQGIIAANLANVETPGYTPSDLSFESELKSALKKGGTRADSAPANPRHIPLKGRAASIDLVAGDLVRLPEKEVGPDGNGVGLENEMGRMAENQIMYNASVQLLTKEFEMMKQAIRGTL